MFDLLVGIQPLYVGGHFGEGPDDGVGSGCARCWVALEVEGAEARAGCTKDVGLVAVADVEGVGGEDSDFVEGGLEYRRVRFCDADFAAGYRGIYEGCDAHVVEVVGEVGAHVGDDADAESLFADGFKGRAGVGVEAELFGGGTDAEPDGARQLDVDVIAGGGEERSLVLSEE